MTVPSPSSPPPTHAEAPVDSVAADDYSLRELTKYFLQLGTFGFGGPIALAGYMQRDLVERRRWISKQDYMEGLALAQLGSEVGIDAQQLERRVADVLPLVRAPVYLARALAFEPAILVLEHPTASLSLDDAKAFAAIVSAVAARRGLTTVGLLMDEKFAKATGGRLLTWQPATGEMKERSSLRFW